MSPAPELEFLLDGVLQTVVDDQPADHPLRRVDRDRSVVYETGEDIDMQAPVKKRKEALRVSNFVGVSSEGSDPTPAGPGQRYDLQTSCSVRVEGLHHFEGGHVDADGQDGVPFDGLYRDIFGAIGARMSYPDVGRPDVSYRDLTITNVDDSQSEHADFSRASFDVVFRGYTQTYG